MQLQTLYQNAIIFSASKHLANNQNVPGTNLPYVVHLSNVAMEIFAAYSCAANFNIAFAVQVALLHDVLEDTVTNYKELENKFGVDIAMAVAALTKNTALPKDQQMPDSLKRIKLMPNEVGAVKLADRITNLQKPPSHWDQHKIINYLEEAKTILIELKDCNEYLSRRLEGKIIEYKSYFVDQSV